MTKSRICVIGNSHAAAICTGLDMMPVFGATAHFDFFAAQKDWMREMMLEGAALVPTSEVTRKKIALHSGGKERIEAHQYTHFMIVGLGFGISGPGFISPFSAFSKYQIAGFSGLQEARSRYISRACFAALTASILRNSTALYLAGLLRSLTDGRIFIVPAPCPSEEILNGEDGGFWRRAVECGAWAYAMELYKKTSSQLVNDAGCEILFQPSDTLTHDSFTQAKFAQGSMRLSADLNQEHPLAEPFHMNASYGSALLKRFAEITRP